jgi:hypothetical protein
VSPLLERLGGRIARYLAAEPKGAQPTVVVGREAHWWNYIQPGDVLLVEGTARISVAIKYLTQSTWSHAALCVGDAAEHPLVEADIVNGVICVPFEKYHAANVRLCRPIRLTSTDCRRLVNFAVRRLGHQYDLKNVLDLARYLLPRPVAASFRSHIGLGSGDPTRAICSTLIAEAFSSIPYPILPNVPHGISPEEEGFYYEIRHHSTFTPRDFDLSPYFSVVKPTVEHSFDYEAFPWQQVIWLIETRSIVARRS